MPEQLGSQETPMPEQLGSQETPMPPQGGIGVSGDPNCTQDLLQGHVHCVRMRIGIRAGTWNCMHEETCLFRRDNIHCLSP